MARSRSLVTVLVSTALLMAGCADDGGQPSGSTTSVAPSTTELAPSPTAGTVPTGGVATVVYFAGDGAVAVAGRAVAPPAVARGALSALLDGPTGFEADLGMSSAIPAGTRLLDIDVDGGLATVDLSGEFLADLGDDTELRVAEVVFTLTQFPTVDRVTILIEDTPTPSVGFDAVPVAEVDRADFEAVTPFVLVESPTPGATVTSPVEVTGIANTFEANVRYEVTDRDGAVLDDGFTTASAGTGTWGTFSFTTDLPAGDAVLTVFQESAEDGSRTDEYGLPVVVG